MAAGASYFAAKRAAEGKPWRSGHCGLKNPDESHKACHGGYNRLIEPVGWVPCCCDCHEPEENAASDQTPAGERAEGIGLSRPCADSAPEREVAAAPPAGQTPEGQRPSVEAGGVLAGLPVPSLRILPDLVQRSEEWYDQRRGMVTASAVGQLLTPTLRVADNETSRSLTALLVAERITGYTEPTFVNDDMWRGIEDEPRALEKYSEHRAPAHTAGFMVRNDWGFEIGYSPDGLVGEDGLVEVKSRRQKAQLRTILDDEVPAENMAQLQCGLLVSGRQWVDYVSYCGGMPLYVRRVYPDPEWHRAIVCAVAQFETDAADLIAAYNQATQGLAPTERVLELEMI